MTDTELLAEFVRTRSPQAFAELVRRYLDLVYSTARRMVGDEHVAEDVTQAAFLILAKKAGGVDPLTLAGWLVNTARLAAREAMRAKICRQQHENRAAQMRSEIQTSREEPTADDLAPLLDDVLAQLSAADRSAVVLRFLQGRSFVEVAAATGISEEAARKRVERALDKLRLIFLKKGFVPSVGGLMLLMASQQATGAPAAVAGSILNAVHLGGTATSAILAKGVAAAMTWAKIKLAAVVILLATLIGGVGVESAKQLRDARIALEKTGRPDLALTKSAHEDTLAHQATMQIPASELRSSSTASLVQKIAGTSLNILVLENPPSDDSIKAFSKTFNGVDVLLTRPDAGVELLAYFENMTSQIATRPTAGDTNTVLENGKFALRFPVIEMLLATDEVRKKLTPTQTKDIISVAVRSLDAKSAFDTKLKDPVFSESTLEWDGFLIAKCLGALKVPAYEKWAESKYTTGLFARRSITTDESREVVKIGRGFCQ